MTRTPHMAHKAPISFPTFVFGTTSPYPTVVMVITLHQKADGIDVKFAPLVSFSA